MTTGNSPVWCPRTISRRRKHRCCWRSRWGPTAILMKFNACSTSIEEPRLSKEIVAGGKPGFELIEATVADVHAAFAAGSLSARQLMQSYPDRIEALDRNGPALNSLI